MPSGSCYCGQAKIFYAGEPIRQVRSRFALVANFAVLCVQSIISSNHLTCQVGFMPLWRMQEIHQQRLLCERHCLRWRLEDGGKLEINIQDCKKWQHYYNLFLPRMRKLHVPSQHRIPWAKSPPSWHHRRHGRVQRFRYGGGVVRAEPCELGAKVSGNGRFTRYELVDWEID